MHRVKARLFSAALGTYVVFGAAVPAWAHEGQVITYGSFLAGVTHPVLGLDHFLAMVSVGIVSALIGGRAIWTVPATFVTMMAVGGWMGWIGLGIGSSVIEVAIALSVVLLGGVILLDRRLRTSVAMAAVAFFGFFHGYAHGQEIPDVANAFLYAMGFLLGTIMIHLLGVLIGDMAKRYPKGRPVLRLAGGVFVITGAMFLLGVL